MNENYLVQSILIDNNKEESIIDSIEVNSYDEIFKTLDSLMEKHKSNSNYIYNVINMTTNSIMYSTMNNKYIDYI